MLVNYLELVFWKGSYLDFMVVTASRPELRCYLPLIVGGRWIFTQMVTMSRKDG